MPSPTPSRHNKSGARRARQNKTPRSDAITLRGRQRVTVTSTIAGGGVYLVYPINPAQLGDRVNNVAVNFNRYRIRSLRFELRSKMPTTTYGTYVAGVDDDAEIDTTLPSPTEQAILDYRVSRERHAFLDLNLNWRPLDASRWYYVNEGVGSSAIDRFVTPCVYTLFSSDNFGVGTSTQVFSLDVHYAIEFAGACEPNFVQLSTPLPPTPSGLPGARQIPLLRK